MNRDKIYLAAGVTIILAEFHLYCGILYYCLHGKEQKCYSVDEKLKTNSRCGIVYRDGSIVCDFQFPLRSVSIKSNSKEWGRGQHISITKYSEQPDDILITNTYL